jgi:multiple sugar transport system substrate-binding protein
MRDKDVPSFTRRATLSAFGAAALLGLTACASGTGAQGSDQGQSIDVYLAQHAWSDSIKKHVAEFEKENGITVRVTTLGEQQLSQQYQIKFNAQAKDVDVMMFSPAREGKQFINNGWLANLQKDVTTDPAWDWNDFNEANRKLVSNAEGNAYGVPLVSERPVLYYRKDLLEKAGIKVPATLEELENAAAALTDTSAGQYGFVARGAGNPAVSSAASFVYAFGSDWEINGKSQLNDSKTKDALSFYGKLLRQYGPPGALNMNWPEATAVFQQGKAAMYTEADSLFANYLDKKASRVADSVGYAPFPAGPAGHNVSNITSWALGTAASSKNSDAAWKFVKWATSPEMSKLILADNNPVTRASAWADPKAVSGYPAELAALIAKPGDIKYVDHTGPKVVNVGKARDVIGTVIATAIQGGDVDAAAEKADKDFQDLLDKEKG